MISSTLDLGSIGILRASADNEGDAELQTFANPLTRPTGAIHLAEVHAPTGSA